MKMMGAQMVIEALKQEKVEVIFGYPGGQVLPLYDALYDADIRHIMPRHEQGGIHAADGYARATGKTGVCIATSGPGATNLVTGIANAYMDSVPLVALTGQVPLHLIGTDAFQEADITGITMPITKHNYLVKNVKEIPRVIKEAFFIASTGRPGPVLIDIPRDILSAEGIFKYPERVEMRGYRPTYSGHGGQINRAIRVIKEARRPVICAGGGVLISGAQQELLQLAEIAQIPVTNTLMGLGSFPRSHPLSLGMLGMHGTVYANYAVTKSDLFIGVGMRFDDRVTGKLEQFVPGAKVIHIDIDPAEIGKNITVDVPIVGDIKRVLTQMIKKAQKCDAGEWISRIDDWKQEYPLCYDCAEKELKPQYVIEQISKITGGDAIIATDVGQHQMWTAQYFSFEKPRTIISSGGLGTMGYGLPAAIGAQIGCPDETVFLIAGDGSIQMNSQELATAVEHKLPIKVAIINNRFLGMVRQWQELFYQRRYSSTSLEFGPDFVKLAEAYGAVGIRINTAEEVVPALERAMEIKDKPVIMDFMVETEENVYPMVPPASPIDQILRGGGKE